MSERKEGEDIRLSEPIDPNVLLLLKNQTDYFEKLLALHKAAFDTQLRDDRETSRRERAVETARVDACRRDDTEAVKVANLTSIKQAETLAASVAENAETLRASMAKTAETLAAQLQLVTSSLDTRLKVVENKQYDLAGTSKGARDMWGWISAGVILFIAVVGFVMKW